MINFRFHIVSLIAVFLAMGLGILVGSTVVDQKIVNRLDSEINGVKKDIKARDATNKQLSQQNKELQQFVGQVAQYAGDDRLDGQPIAVVAEQGVDSDTVKQTVDALRLAGADVPGALWLQDEWQLDSDQRVQDLQTALGIRGSLPRTKQLALAELANRIARGSRTSTTTTTTTEQTADSRSTSSTTSTSSPARTPVDALSALEQANFLRITDGDASAFDAFPAHAPDVLVITGDDSHFLGSGLTASFVHALVGAKVPTAVGAVYDPGGDATDAPERGAVLAPVLDDKTLSHSVTTVDDLEMVQGRAAAVLALELLGAGNIGHYGYGAGASAPLPPHRS
jgi:hypothetical protein